MSDAPDRPPPVDYASPSATAASDRRLIKGVFLGFGLGAAIVLLFPIGSGMMYEWLSENEYAFLGGLYLGGMAGGILLLASTVAAFVIGVRRQNPLVRGVARGLLLMIGLTGLTAGVCAVVLS